MSEEQEKKVTSEEVTPKPENETELKNTEHKSDVPSTDDKSAKPTESPANADANTKQRGGGRRKYGNNNNRRPRRDDRTPEEKEFTETLVQLNRVAKVLKGGRRFSFSALVIVGNKKGKVGYGFGKAGDVSEAIRKAIDNAKKQIITIKMYKSTIPHWVIGKFDTAQVLLKPAAPGTGVIAGGPVRIILEMAGCSDILSKCMGSRNSVNVVRATFEGLSQILSAKKVAEARGKNVREIWS